MRFNYDNRKFKSVVNSVGGDVGVETIFHYHQDGELVWAEYSGGEIVYGTLIAKCAADGTLDMRMCFDAGEPGGRPDSP